METNESTIFTDGNIQTGKEKNAQQRENGWQSVTIGGVTGILMGAGGMYAATASGKDESATERVDIASDKAEEKPETTVNSTVEAPSHVVENGLKVAEVDQNLSFGQAFQAAREAVGAGGVFHWHGGIYNTYRLEEWNAMSAEERRQFAQQVRPEIRPGEENTGHKNDMLNHDAKHEERVEQKHEENGRQKTEDSHKEDPQESPKEEADGEVHFLGFTNVKLEGHDYEAGHMSARIDGEERHVYYVDLDHDDKNEFDIGLIDANDDGEFTLREAFDVRDGHINVDQFAIASSMDEANQESAEAPNQVAMNSQDTIANDMPDYANDADPTL